MNDNVFVGAPTGSGKTVCAEFALLRLWSTPNHGRCVYIAPFQEVVDLQVAQWRQKFGKIQGGKNIVALTGETSADLHLYLLSQIIRLIDQQSYSCHHVGNVDLLLLTYSLSASCTCK